LNYKVNENKLHSKQAGNIFWVDTLHFKTQATSNSRRKTACNKSIAASGADTAQHQH
jgi:hypothetical protein